MHPGAGHDLGMVRVTRGEKQAITAPNSLVEAGMITTEYDLLLASPNRFAPMKNFRLLTLTCLLGATFAASAAEPSKEADRDQQQVAALSKEIQGQVTAMADNQTKIDAKLTTIAEALRLARIYASRGGH